MPARYAANIEELCENMSGLFVVSKFRCKVLIDASYCEIFSLINLFISIVLEIRALASKLVEQWLKTVKGEEVIPIQVTDIQHIISEAETEIHTECNLGSVAQPETVCVESNVDKLETVNLDTSPESDTENVENISEIKDNDNDAADTEKETLPVLKITLKNGKQILSQVDDEDNKSSDDSSDKEKSREKHRSRSKDKSRDRSASRSSSKRSSKSSSSDKHKSSHKSSSSSSKHRSKDKSREKEKHSSSSHSSKSKDGTSSDKKSSSSSSSSSSSKSKDRYDRQDKEKNKEKDKDNKTKDGTQKSSEKPDEKSQSPSIQKLGKIPKLSDVKREKPSISIEIRKPDEPKPKTVKTFNSKFRKHGLEEEVKPPPSRASLLNKKPPPVLPPTVSIPKRPSPVHNDIPPEKKPKTLDIEKPGAIKLIPPKPKRKYILVSQLMSFVIMLYFFSGADFLYELSVSFRGCKNINFCYIIGKSEMYKYDGSMIFFVKYLILINSNLNRLMVFCKPLNVKQCL